MSFEWSEYLTLAQELVLQSKNSSISEAWLRSAISRAYYAAFRGARNHLRDKESKTLAELLRGNTYQNVIDLFAGLHGRSKNITYLMISQFLRDLRSMRNKVDYDDTVKNLPGLATSALAQAESVMSWLQTL